MVEYSILTLPVQYAASVWEHWHEIEFVQWQFLARDEGDAVSAAKTTFIACPSPPVEPPLSLLDVDYGE